METEKKLSPRDANTLRQRQFYEKNKTEVNKRVLERYHERRAKRAEAGEVLRGRGRPRRPIQIPTETPTEPTQPATGSPTVAV